MSPIPLQGPQSNEPSIAIASDGTVAVTAPAGETSPTMVAEGSLVWVSRDGGATFRLAINSDSPTEPPAASCSCDTDITAVGDELFTTTLHYTVYPLFNIAVSASTDHGQTWAPRNPASIRHIYPDRPWLAPGPKGDLLLQYRASPDNVGELAAFTPLTYRTTAVWLQSSADGGRDWGEAVAVAKNTEDDFYFFNSKPASVAPDTVIVPLLHERNSTGFKDGEFVAAVSHDGGKTFKNAQVAPPFATYAAFEFSLTALPSGRMVAAWSAPDATGALKIHLRESLDRGDTWGESHTIEVPGQAMQPWAALRSDGVLAVSYYGTDADGPLLNLSKDTPWHARAMLFSPNQLEAPVAVATLSKEPVLQGILCNLRVNCPKGDSASPMREFLNSAWAPDGSLFTVFTDAREVEGNHGRITVTSLQVH
jgi:hypothetical protein